MFRTDSCSGQRPEYQALERWYIIMGLATVHGFDGAATFFDSCLWTVGKEGDGERHCDATSQFYQRNVMWIVPLLAKSGAVAVCEAYLSAVMDLCVEGEPGTNSHKCVAQNAAAGCSTAWGKVPAFLKFSDQSLEISRRGLQLVGEEAKKLGATVCCLSETAAFWPREQYKKATVCGRPCAALTTSLGSFKPRCARGRTWTSSRWCTRPTRPSSASRITARRG